MKATDLFSQPSTTPPPKTGGKAVDLFKQSPDQAAIKNVTDDLNKQKDNWFVSGLKAIGSAVQDPKLGMKVGKGALEMVATLGRETLKEPIQFPRAIVSGVAGLTGNEELKKAASQPIQVPLLGEVKGLSAVPGETEKYGTQTAGETLGQMATSFLETGAPGSGAILKLAKTPFTKLAEKLYQSALKPSEEAIAKGVIQTGLKERVWLTSGGVEKAAQKIDDLEEQLGAAIAAGAAAGKKVSMEGIEKFVDPIRKWFNTVDVGASKAAQEYIDTTVETFKKTFGNEIPIEQAQELKVNTMRYLRNAYGEITNVAKETQKQMVRYLKEGIVKEAPVVGDVNARLSSLYSLDESLGKASKRIGNLNLLGLGTKIGAAAGGKAGALIGLVADLIDKPFAKSGVAIGIDELANLAEKSGNKAAIPISELLNLLIKSYGESESPPQD